MHNRAIATRIKKQCQRIETQFREKFIGLWQDGKIDRDQVSNLLRAMDGLDGLREDDLRRVLEENLVGRRSA